MKITKELIKERFDTLNYECFDNEIASPDKFKIMHSFKVVGRVSQDTSKKKTTLAISDWFELSNAMLDDVIAHEMIHLLQIQRFGKAKHDKFFKDMMKKLNNMYALNIHVKAKDVKLNQKGQKKYDSQLPKNKILKQMTKLLNKLLSKY